MMWVALLAVIVAVLLIGVGVMLCLGHVAICNESTRNAYKLGYEQAQKEQRIRLEAEATYKPKEPTLFQQPIRVAYGDNNIRVGYQRVYDSQGRPMGSVCNNELVLDKYRK